MKYLIKDLITKIINFCLTKIKRRSSTPKILRISPRGTLEIVYLTDKEDLRRYNNVQDNLSNLAKKQETQPVDEQLSELKKLSGIK